MKIIFMGTPDFAVPTLKKLIEEKHEVLAVVTKEDKPQGRGHKIDFSPIKHLAIENDLNVLQPTKMKDRQFINTLKLLAPDLMVVIAYGKILPKEILEIPIYGCINVHASLLPKYRGAAPIHWAVLNGEKTTGVTTMLLDEGMDTGDILLKEEIDISSTDTTGSLHDKLASLGANLLIKTVAGVEDKTITRTKQDNENATYTKLIHKSMGLINWNKKSFEILNFTRGLTPWPSAYTYYEGKMMKIFEAEILDTTYEKKQPGEIVAASEKGITVKTGDGSLLITKIQVQDSKAMKVSDYIHGNKINIGSILDIKTID